MLAVWLYTNYIFQITCGKTYCLKSPIRKRTAKRLARRSYHAIIRDFLKSFHLRHTILQSVIVIIKKEIIALCKDTVLLGNKENIMKFNWDMVHKELVAKCPTLFLLIKKITTSSVGHNIPLASLLVSMILKNHNKHISLVQSAISLLMYGNGCPKQV